MRRHPTHLLLALTFVGLAAGFAAPVFAQSTARLSDGPGGVEGDGDSTRPSISEDGALIAFYSEATTLVAGDTNLVGDIFVYDRTAGTLTRASTASGGAQGNGQSSRPDLSGGGRYVAFQSDATNLVPGDTNLAQDAFVKDLLTGAIVRVSVSSTGVQANANSSRVRVSSTGRYVVYSSDASNLVAGDVNGWQDVFLHDRDTDGDGIFDEPGAISTVIASRGAGGVQGNEESGVPVVSDDGRWVAFRSKATNFVPGDTNLESDVFVRDMQAGTTVRVSVSTGGGQGDLESSRPMMSADGRHVAFYSRATNLVPGDTNQHFDTVDGIWVPARDAFVRDRDTDGDGIYDEPGAVKTVRVSVADDGSQANDRSEDPDISPDGRWVVFWTEATNIFGGDGNGELQDIVLHDRDVDGDGIFDEPGAFGNTLISVSTAGVQANSNSKRCVVSADGRFVAFRSDATNLVSPDTNSPFEDVFLRDVTGAAWADLGHALAGLNGDPQLSGTGTLAGGSAGTLDLGNARPNTLAFLFVGFVNGVAPFKQGILVPVPWVLLVPNLPTGPSGSLSLPFLMPTGLPSGFTFYMQYAIQDAAAVAGVALSNAVSGTTP
ncbi:MAG: TolB family protein [Planctomycetota bacterium]|jgi:Tol biopolymer transport system component